VTEQKQHTNDVLSFTQSMSSAFIAILFTDGSITHNSFPLSYI